MARYGKEWGSITAASQKQIKDDIPMVISESEPTAYGEEY
jgi:hypothetical protein